LDWPSSWPRCWWTGAAQDTTEISGDVTQTYEISAHPADNTAFGLDPSATQPVTHTGTLSVNANTAWTVTASADSGTGHTKGYMSKYSSSAYVEPEVKLASNMQIKSTDTGYTDYADLTSDQAVATGSGAESGITVTFGQNVAWNDAHLGGSDVYRIVVTFTIA